jgi:hypothetical protein
LNGRVDIGNFSKGSAENLGDLDIVLLLGESTNDIEEDW